MGVIPNPKMAFIFPISCILVLISPIFMIYFPICVGKGSFPKSEIKSLSLMQNWTFIERYMGQFYRRYSTIVPEKFLRFVLDIF